MQRSALADSNDSNFESKESKGDIEAEAAIGIGNWELVATINAEAMQPILYLYIDVRRRSCLRPHHAGSARTERLKRID